MSTDAERAWWPEYALVTDALRRVGRAEIADALRDAVRGGATGTEILGRVGLVLRAHDAERARLDADGKHAWDAMVHAVNESRPLPALAYWIRRLLCR